MDARLLEIADWVRQNPREAGGDIYHPLPFEEFRTLRTSSKASASEDKWRLIERSLGSRADLAGKTILDVGANAGFFSFSMAQRGARVDAYEPHEYYVSLGRRIAQATSLDVTWFQRPLTAGDLAGKHYDIALMLSVFQWISEGNQRLDQAVELLETVARSTRTLYFELGCNAGKSAIEVDGATAWGRARRYMFAATGENLRLTRRQRTITRLLEFASARGGAGR
jgi:SAM-dependent methyltransferase